MVLPNEILFHVFSYLDPRSFQNAGLVCNGWRIVSLDEKLQDVVYDDAFFLGRGLPSISCEDRKELHRNFKSRVYRLISLKSKYGLKIWCMSDHETLWCSPRKRDSFESLLKIHITSGTVLNRYFVPFGINDIVLDDRFLVVLKNGGDKSHHDIPYIDYTKKGDAFETLEFSTKERLSIRNIRLKDHILLTHCEQADDDKTAIFIVWNLLSDTIDFFEIKNCQVVDLCIINTKRCALIIQDASVFSHSRDENPLARSVVLFDFIAKCELERVRFSFVTNIMKVNPDVLLINDESISSSGLTLIDSNSLKRIGSTENGTFKKRDQFKNIEILSRKTFAFGATAHGKLGYLISLDSNQCHSFELKSSLEALWLKYGKIITEENSDEYHQEKCSARDSDEIMDLPMKVTRILDFANVGQESVEMKI